MWIFDPCLQALKRTYVCHIKGWGQFHFFQLNSNSNPFFFSTLIPIPQLTMSYKSNSNSDDFNWNFNFEDFNWNLNFNISQSSSKLSMVIITWYIELLISLYHISFLFPFLKDCNFMVSRLIKYQDLLEQHRCHYLNQCWFLSTGLSRNLNRHSDIFIQEYSCENPVFKMADILSGLMLAHRGLNKTAKHFAAMHLKAVVKEMSLCWDTSDMHLPASMADRPPYSSWWWLPVCWRRTGTKPSAAIVLTGLW